MGKRSLFNQSRASQNPRGEVPGHPRVNLHRMDRVDIHSVVVFLRGCGLGLTTRWGLRTKRSSIHPASCSRSISLRDQYSSSVTGCTLMLVSLIFHLMRRSSTLGWFRTQATNVLLLVEGAPTCWADIPTDFQ